MRLALASQEYPPETAHGGIGTQTYLKAHGLAALGHEVIVLSHSTEDRKQEMWTDSVRVVRIPGFDDRLLYQTEPVRWLTYSALVAAELTELHRQTPLDLIDFPEWASEGYVHLLNREEWNRIPTVIHLHGPLVMFARRLGWPELDSELYRTGTMMEGTCLRLADAVFSSSRCSAEWCADAYGLDASRIPVMHTGVDTNHFHPLDLPKEDRPTLAFVGKIARNKGVDLLLEVALLLAKEWPDLQLRLMGRGDERLIAEMQIRAAACGSPDLLRWVGFVDREDLPAELSRAHVFAAPSLYEGGPGFVYLEAMACGLPVVACSGSGASEVVKHGENGLLAPPGDLHALVQVLRQLLHEPEAREQMGQRARDYAVREANSALCLRKIEAFYESVAATGR
ncbi:MAG: glycosyltransferase family 4 protein [Armatimonadetes bacterium]|nr:glycosyltransferase family 4 protein [Armatimonadota bacterium]